MAHQVLRIGSMLGYRVCHGSGGSKGAPGTRAPGVQIFFNFMQFLGKFGKIVCWCPPGEFAPQPRGSPGSTTAWVLLRYDTIGKIELIPSIVLSSDNTKYKNDIQLFLQLFDELSVYRDYH